jgi:large subunit ribosomal protein L3
MLELFDRIFIFISVKVGAGQKKENHLTKPELGHFRAHGVPLKRKLKEFPVTEDGLLPVCTPISVRHFLPGQYVDITATSRGKGFQVCMSSYCALSFFFFIFHMKLFCCTLTSHID